MATLLRYMRVKNSLIPRLPAGLLGMLLVVTGVVASARVQNQFFTIRVNVPLVSVNVEVLDAFGRPVTSLRQEDFVVYEDGQLQKIQTFGSADLPYSLILIFDCSESTRREWPLLHDAVTQFAKYQRPSDRVMVAAFGEQVQVIRDWNSSKEKNLERDGIVCAGTRLYDALQWTISKLRGVKSRKGVVMLTDGADASTPRRPVLIGGRRGEQFVDFESDRAFQKSLRSLAESGVTYYFVAVKTDHNPGFEWPPEFDDLVIPDLRQMRLRMEQFAGATGGSVVYPVRPEEVAPVYERIGQQLGSTYSLGYAPPNRDVDGKSHKIEIRVPGRDLQVRQSRDTYVVR